MSGICGFVSLDGKPAEEADLNRMLGQLERRGPDGTVGWIDGSIALGHTLLATTPEAQAEKLPHTHQQSGCTITADVRLDNRADLLASLGLHTPEIGDGELILRSYLKWGEDCLGRLLGDFAFAIWDSREQLLFCARDLTGMRQLVYHHSPGKVLVFATEPEAVLQHSDVARRLNEGRIGDFLEGLEAYDLSSTFYQGIAKLPPGHSLTLRDRQLRIKRSMQLAAPARLKLPSDEAYAEAFRDVFTEAVRSRLRSPAPVASMLSGGMDSGSVSAIAARLLKQSQAPPLHTFSAIGTDPECPETRAIEAALEIDHISPTRISLGEIASYRADLERLVNASAEPFDASMTLLYAVYLFAQRSGHKVMLDGVGGDTTLGSPNMIAWHLRGGRVMQAWREAKGEEQFWDHPEPALPGFIRGVRQAYIPQWLRDLRGAFRQNGERTSASLVSPDFDERIGMTERRLENAEHIALSWGDSLENRMKRVLHPYIIVARERYDRVASALAIEPRDPFLDRRVLEFCLSLPADQLQKNGWPKTVLRRSMDGLLPDAVRWRAGKEHLGWDFTQSLWRDSEDLAEVIDSPLVQDYIRAAEWGTKILHGEHDSSFEDRLTIHYLSAWISMRGRVEQATEHS